MRLKEALKNKRFVVTTEVQAPVEQETGGLIENLNKIRGRVDGVLVSEVEFEGVAADTITACEIISANRFESIYQITTRDKNRLQIQKDLLEASKAGVDNLLVFTEDYRITGDSLQEMMFFHLDAGKISSVLEHMREGRTVEGRDLESGADFLLGSGVESAWGGKVPDLALREMEEMTRVGAGYFLTTPVFDLDRFEKFLARTSTFGVPVIAEVIILRTAGMARFLNRHFKPGLVPDRVIRRLAEAPDKEKASIELFGNTVKGLKDICDGIHIITIGGEEKLRYYLDAAGLR
ncbi:MAG TPA: methylenetetrahydrofolate reductase [Desulfobacteraceae bacterium]|nr:methylenetetrahydrofolate reductase [Desulfobacteraceae bacterium]